MPLVHEQSFRVRFHDSDMHKMVRDASYLRYMQEAAFAASAAAGYPEERYQIIRRLWLIRETLLEIRSPLRYGDSVRIKTWVASFGKVRSRRAYELRLDGADEPIAVAHTDWVLIDLDTEWPAVIPDEMIAGFSPEGAVRDTSSRQRFPVTPPAPQNAWQQRQVVQWRDLDSVGHVNNAVYADYIQDAAHRELAARGWITQIERDTTGAVCRAFDMNPDAPGFAAVCHPLADDHVVIEVGEGVGDEEADLRAAGVVAVALEGGGLTTEVELREGAAVVMGCLQPGGR